MAKKRGIYIKKMIFNWRLNLILLRNKVYDFKSYWNLSATKNNKKNKSTHASELIFYYHKIEKGLALPKPKIGFGKESIEYLVDSLEIYVYKYGWDEVSNIALNTLKAYLKFNKEKKIELKELSNKVEVLEELLGNKIFSNKGGILKISKKEILESSSMDFEKFTYSRYSIRNYTDEEVSDDLILKAIRIAQKTPSVCNRQSSKVHIFSNKEIKKIALSFQNGNAGFGEKASKVLLVTSNIEDFFGVGERHQPYIDGGMFAMSLIYALHSLGVGTCALNLALDYRQAISLKNALNIEPNEMLITMIAVGNIPDNLFVAESPRKALEEIVTLY